MSNKIIKNIVLHSCCLNCGHNKYDLFFPIKRVKAKCTYCNYERELTHTEINSYLYLWA